MKRPRSMIIVDLDDTLLNSFAMYEAAILELEHFGVTAKNFWAAEDRERQQRARTDNKRYSFFDHMMILSVMLKLDYRDFEEMEGNMLDFIRENSGDFLFNDGADFLFSFNRESDLILMTSGPQDLQQAKLDGIIASGFDLQEYFRQIIIATELKGHYIDKICPLDNNLNVFIDDSPKQINSVAKIRPDVLTIWMNREGAKANKDNKEIISNHDHMTRDFYDVDDILSEIL